MVNGPKKEFERRKESKFGKTEVSLKVIGSMTKLMVMEGSSMQMVMFTMVNGTMTRCMDVVHMNL